MGLYHSYIQYRLTTGILERKFNFFLAFLFGALPKTPQGNEVPLTLFTLSSKSIKGGRGGARSPAGFCLIFFAFPF